MLRCKIKGTGKKRKLLSDGDEDDKQIHVLDTKVPDTTVSHEFSLVTPIPCQLRQIPPDPTELHLQDEKDDWEADKEHRDTASLLDGDLLFFEGSPFHFLDAETIPMPMPSLMLTAPLFPFSIEADTETTLSTKPHKPQLPQSHNN